MKKIFLLFTIIAISFACKKKSVEPTPEEPVKTSKSFKARIEFTTDSLVGYNYFTGYIGSTLYKDVVIIAIDTVPYYTANYGIQANANHFTNGNNNTFTSYFTPNVTTTNLNKSFTYYINVYEKLYKISGGVAQYRYSKIYTFHEGDNGIINFNTLP